MSPKPPRQLTPSEAERNVETLLAWEARKQLKLEQLKLDQAAAELDNAPFRPLLAPNTLRIMMEKDQRAACLSERQQSEICVRASVKAAVEKLQPDTKTHFDMRAFVSSSLPGSRCTSPETEGPHKVAIRNDLWLQAKNAKLSTQQNQLPSGATFHPTVNPSKRHPLPPRPAEPLACSSQNLSTKATARVDEKTKSGAFSPRNLSPATKQVSYQAGLDLSSFLKRAKPLVQLKDLGL